MGRLKDRIHYLELGPWPLFVGFATSDNAFQREMKRLKVKGAGHYLGPNASASTHYLRSSGGDRTTVICAPKPNRSRSREQYAALIAHEATHVIQDMRAELGELGHEAEAYIVQHIVQSCLEIAWETGRFRRLKPS